MSKNSLISFLMLCMCITPALASCGSEDGGDPAPGTQSVKVTVAPELLSAGAGAETLELSVTADADWSIRSDADWAVVRPSGGLKDKPSVIQVSVAANNELDPRTASINIVCGGKSVKAVALTQNCEAVASVNLNSITFGGQESSSVITVTSNSDWELTSSESWLTFTPSKGGKGETEVTFKASANDSGETRSALVALGFGDKSTEIKVSQLSDEVIAPEGYTLVWSDEFNEDGLPGKDWVAENWAAGYVNNELQTYTDKEVDGKRTLEVKDGFLNINCFKGSDGKIYSGRMNARPSTGWTYGYFEARICLPSGKGTWPAFWMMPSNVDWGSNPWPKCGELDIMEEVGANPDYVSSSLHTEKYNHTKNTQKTHEMKVNGAEGEFHTYAVEWTEDAITTYVDGKVQLQALKSQMGSDHDSWPFHYAFYPILNLAWGGDWGGYKGIDENALPVTMKVDYVRIFQK